MKEWAGGGFVLHFFVLFWVNTFGSKKKKKKKKKKLVLLKFYYNFFSYGEGEKKKLKS